MTPHFWSKNDKNAPGGYFQKNWVGMCDTLPETLTPFQTSISVFQYFRPDQKFDTLFQNWSAGARRVTSCCGTYTVVGVNIEREMVLSPNDEEVANSSKKHTQFKTRVHKPYPITDQNGWKKHTLWCRTYPYSLYKGLPPGRKTLCRLLV